MISWHRGWPVSHRDKEFMSSFKNIRCAPFVRYINLAVSQYLFSAVVPPVVELIYLMDRAHYEHI